MDIRCPPNRRLLLLVFCVLFVAGWQVSKFALEENSLALIRISVGMIFLAGLLLWFVRLPASLNRRCSPSPVVVSCADQDPGLFRWRPFALVASVLATGFVILRIPRLGPHDDYGLVFWSWIAGLLLYGFATSGKPRLRRSPNSFTVSGFWLAFGAVGLLALFLRTWSLGTIPFTLGGDEASQGFEALRVLKGELRNPFATGWMGLPTLSFFYGGCFIPLLGPTVTALRLPWALVGTLSVLASFYLVRRLSGPSIAWLAMIFLGTYHFHIHVSRLGSNNIADTLFLPLALLFVIRGLELRSRLDWILAGAFAGWSVYLYIGGRLTPVVLGLLLVYRFLWRPGVSWSVYRRDLASGLGAFLITVLPILQYALRYPDDFNARLNQVGIFQSGWLEREIPIRGESAWIILMDQFERAALAFNYFPDRTVWYGLQEPLLSPLFGCLFLLGLFYGTISLFRWESGKQVAPMVLWWWSGMILGGMLTESPPSSQRLITLSVPTCFFMALATTEVSKLVKTVFVRFPARALLAFTLLLFVPYSLKTYFWDYTPQRLYGGRNAEMATYIAPTLNDFKEDYRFYFVGAPWMYWGFATLPFLVPGADAIDILEPLKYPGIREVISPDRGALFIVLPTRIAELEVLERAFPEGVSQEVYSPVDGRLMVMLFRHPDHF